MNAFNRLKKAIKQKNRVIKHVLGKEGVKFSDAAKRKKLNVDPELKRVMDSLASRTDITHLGGKIGAAGNIVQPAVVLSEIDKIEELTEILNKIE